MTHISAFVGIAAWAVLIVFGVVNGYRQAGQAGLDVADRRESL